MPASTRSTGAYGGERSPPLIERRRELDALGHAVTRARAGAGGSIVISGPPGIGVSALLSAGIAAAHEREMAVAQLEPDSAAALIAAARRHPLLVVLDDADQADAALLSIAGNLTERFQQLPALLLIGTHATDGLTLAAQRILRPSALSSAGVRELLLSHCASPIGPEVVELAVHGTGGLAAEVVAFAEEWDRIGAPTEDEPSRIAGAVADRVAARRIARLTEAGTQLQVAEAVALLAEWATPQRVATLLGLGLAAVRPEIDRLVSVGLLAQPAHPTFVRRADRDTLIAEMPLGRGDRLRAGAVSVLAGEGETVGAGTLLLELEPAGDAARADALWEAADLALRTDRPSLSTRLLQRLLDEPAPPALQSKALVTLGVTQVQTGEIGGVDILRRALNEATEPGQVADAASALGWALAGRRLGEDAESALLQGRARLAGATDELAIALDVQIADMTAWDASLRQARVGAVARLKTADGSALAAAAVLAAAGTDGLAGGEPADQIAGLCQRALADGVLADSPRGAPTALAMGVFLGYTGRGASGIDHLNHVIARLAHNDLQPLIRPATAFRGAVKLMLGRLADAESDLRAVIGAPWLIRSTPLCSSFLLLCLLERGADDEAAEFLSGIDFEGGEVARMIPHAPFLFARAEFRARRSDPHGALHDLRRCGDWLTEGGWVNPVVAAWRGSAARILSSLGELEEARALATEEVARAERFGVPAVLARALCAQAATLEPAAAHTLLTRALGCTDREHSPLEHVRALVELAANELVLGHKADARPRLHRALAVARPLGAEAHARRAELLLRSAGGRPRSPREDDSLALLTPTERRVAQLAGTGRTNAEIGAELFVSPKTVESHLSAVYGKLGIRSRALLSSVLTD